MTRILKTLSTLLSYPTVELQLTADEIGEVIARETRVPFGVREQLHQLLTELFASDVRDLQDRYMLLFHYTRSLSLHIHDLVRCESRDPGRAKINHGLLRGSEGELPDWLPQRLSYLSGSPQPEAYALLRQLARVFAVLAERLRNRNSGYEAVFRALIALSSTDPAGSPTGSWSKSNNVVAIHSLTSSAGFGPDAIEAMVVAYESALSDLILIGRHHPFVELIAKSIVNMCAIGERAPDTIKKRALNALGVRMIAAA